MMFNGTNLDKLTAALALDSTGEYNSKVYNYQGPLLGVKMCRILVINGTNGPILLGVHHNDFVIIRSSVVWRILLARPKSYSKSYYIT